MTTALPRPFTSLLHQTSGLEAAAATGAKSHNLLAAPGQRVFVDDARGSSPPLLFAELESSAEVAVDADVGDDSQRRQLTASRLSADSGSGDDVGGGHSQPWEEALVVREGSEVFDLKGQCSDGDSFTISSEALPDTEGCYSSVPGTSFGVGFLYSTDDTADKRTVYPKIVTIDGESRYFWAASPLALFSGDDVVIDCLSFEPTSTAIHPASATWQCDVDATGQLVLVDNDEFFLVCGCGTSATSGSSSSGSSGGNVTPAPADRGESFTATPTSAPTTAAPGSTVAPGSTAVPTNAPTPAASSAQSDEEREVSGGRPRSTRDSSPTVMTAAAAVVAAAATLAAGVCATNYAVFEGSVL